MPKHSTRKAKGSKETVRKPGLRDLEARTTKTAKGGFGNTSRFDPYRNFRFRPA